MGHITGAQLCGVDGMWKNSTGAIVPSQVLGALSKRGCQSSIAPRTSDLALEMSQGMP